MVGCKRRWLCLMSKWHITYDDDLLTQRRSDILWMVKILYLTRFRATCGPSPESKFSQPTRGGTVSL